MKRNISGTDSEWLISYNPATDTYFMRSQKNAWQDFTFSEISQFMLNLGFNCWRFTGLFYTMYFLEIRSQCQIYSNSGVVYVFQTTFLTRWRLHRGSVTRFCPLRHVAPPRNICWHFFCLNESIAEARKLLPLVILAKSVMLREQPQNTCSASRSLIVSATEHD